MKVAQKLAHYVRAFRFEDLPPDVIHQSRRVLMDAIGCCIGAFDADACRIAHGVIKELGGRQESTVIGSGLRTSCLNAALVNGLMVRYLDFNDLYALPAGKWYIGVHPSDAIPGILALAERTHASGKELITARSTYKAGNRQLPPSCSAMSCRFGSVGRLWTRRLPSSGGTTIRGEYTSCPWWQGSFSGSMKTPWPTPLEYPDVRA